MVASLGGEKNLAGPAKQAARDGADFIEVRADTLHPSVRVNLGRQLDIIKRAARLPVILTVRSPKEQQKGAGFYRMNDAERGQLFTELMDRVDVIDVELHSAKSLAKIIRLAHKKKKKVILSYHNFARFPTGAEVSRLKREFTKYRGDILKTAVPAKSAGDLLKLIKLCQNLAPLTRVVIGMGGWGKTFRVAGFRFGSCLTYGYVTKPMAPGQLPVRELSSYARRLEQNP